MLEKSIVFLIQITNPNNLFLLKTVLKYTFVYAMFCVVFVTIAFIVLYLVEDFSARVDVRVFLQTSILT